jgi:hypothetical protein
MNGIVIKYVQGDSLPEVNLYIVKYYKGNQKVYANISNSTVKFKLYNLNTQQQINEGHDDCLIINPTIGMCKYITQEEDLINYGRFEAVVEVLYNAGNKHTAYDKIPVIIRN